MAIYEPIKSAALVWLDLDGLVVAAAKVLGRVTQNGAVSIHVATWDTWRGQESLYLSPADFATWRASLLKQDKTIGN